MITLQVDLYTLEDLLKPSFPISEDAWAEAIKYIADHNPDVCLPLRTVEGWRAWQNEFSLHQECEELTRRITEDWSYYFTAWGEFWETHIQERMSQL